MKSDGSIRICEVTINQAMKVVDPYPLPRVEELFAKLAGGKQFSKLDMSQAYLQLTLEEHLREFVTISTHKGLFQFNRLPFGVSAAPSIFQRCMESLLQCCNGVSVYLDDILVMGNTPEEHLQNLDAVLEKLASTRLRFKRSKCEFMLPSVEYHPTKDKVKAIKEAPKPKNVSKLRSFLGIINYYGPFMANLSTQLSPLYDL